MRTSAIALLAAGAFLSADAGAQIKPGTKAPEIEVKNWFHSPPATSLEELKGRVVLIEYWATW